MTDASTSPGRRFVDEFSAWLNPRDPAESDNRMFFESATIVVDTNVLLDLYRVSSATRAEILSVLSRSSDRLWVPNQVALEYSRNRRKVVIDRNKEFSSMKALLRKSERDAIDGLELALKKFLKFRDRNRSSRDWDPVKFGVDKESLQGRISGLWHEALMELDNLEKEIDLSEKDLATDPILVALDNILTGRVGPAPSSKDLQRHVEEFVNFRYPNKLPPGYADVDDKDEPVRQAGDFLLWRQLIDHVGRSKQLSPRRVMLVTGDSKPDWWELDREGNPLRARSELVHELRREANAELLLISLTQLLQGAKDYLQLDVSDAAISEVQEREEADQLAALLPASVGENRTFDPFRAHPADLESVVLYLLLKMEFEVSRRVSGIQRSVDFIVKDSNGERLAVEVYLRRPEDVSSRTIMRDARRLSEYMKEISREVPIDRGMMITTAQVPPSDRVRIEKEFGNIAVIDGQDLRDLLTLYADIHLDSFDSW
ncbi:PIN-like domain-containing protein [Nocardia nova]|uniref:PIN-like domain-containing protein n=1 Tax=Nocardia nova TaxID=37330 RepID=UPI0033C5D3B1